MKLVANLFAYLGEFIANTTSSASFWSFWDEEEMPEELL